MGQMILASLTSTVVRARFAGLATSSLGVATMLGCAAGTTGGRSAPPVIDSIEPRTGLAGVAYPVEIVISGHGFTDQNTVRFGDMVLDGLESTNNRTRISFMAPKEQRSTGEAPPMVLPPGRYSITVTTPSGTSSPVYFELVRGGEAGT